MSSKISFATLEKDATKLAAGKLLNKGKVKSSLKIGNNCYLVHPASGADWFRFVYRFNDKRLQLSLGLHDPLGKGGLSIRAAHFEAGRLLGVIAKGNDPLIDLGRESSHKTKGGVTCPFADVATAWRSAKLVPKKLSHKSMLREDRYLRFAIEGKEGKPGLGPLACADICDRHLAPILDVMDSSDRGRFLATMKSIMRFAKARGFFPENIATPFQDIKLSDSFADHEVVHWAAIIDETQFGQLLRTLDAKLPPKSDIWYAFQLLILTAVRSEHIREMRWECIDLDRARWTIPAVELKMYRKRKKKAKDGIVPDFVVPLSPSAVALLRELHRARRPGQKLVFARNARMLSNDIFTVALHAAGYKGVHTPHGFRTSFRTIMQRQRGEDGSRLFDRFALEMALDHEPRDATEATYDRDDLLLDRIAIAAHWSNKVDQMRGEAGAVIPMRREAAHA